MESKFIKLDCVWFVRVSQFLINKEELEELYDKRQYLENVISTQC